jgi:molybdopterin-guanine dinucleotide biosynthesis protein A
VSGKPGGDYNKEDFTAAILAGGRARRLGTNKALLEIEGRTILDRILEKMLEVFPDVLLVVKDEDSPLSGDYGPRVKVVADLLPGKGPLGGIYTALEHSPSPYVFVMACDMPYPNLALVRRLLSEAEGREAVVPRKGPYIEPLFAVYHRDTYPRIKKRLEADDLKIHDFIDEIDALLLEEEEVCGCDPDLRSFFNINTPEDLEKAR